MFRFFILLFTLSFVLTSSFAHAQFDALEELEQAGSRPTESKDTMTVEEYKNIPPGLLMPPEEKTVDTNAAATETKSTTVITDSAHDDIRMTYEGALDFYKQGKYKEIVSSLEFLAENGHAGAMELLGIMNRLGQGVPKNTVRAIDILSKVAEQSRPLAQHHLGIMYFLGEGLEQPDMTRALMWLNLAVVYYPDGPEKEQARKDREVVFKKISRRDKDAGLQMAREWLAKRGEGHLLEGGR